MIPIFSISKLKETQFGLFNIIDQAVGYYSVPSSAEQIQLGFPREFDKIVTLPSGNWKLTLTIKYNRPYRGMSFFLKSDREIVNVRALLLETRHYVSQFVDQVRFYRDENDGLGIIPYIVGIRLKDKDKPIINLESDALILGPGESREVSARVTIPFTAITLDSRFEEAAKGMLLPKSVVGGNPRPTYSKVGKHIVFSRTTYEFKSGSDSFDVMLLQARES